MLWFTVEVVIITQDFEKVEKALFRKATGYKETVTKPVKCKTILYEGGKKARESEEIVYANEDVFVAPDTTAMSFWLRNRRPDRWKNKPEDAETEADNGVLNDIAEFLKMQREVNDE